MENIRKLTISEATVMHNVDATNMSSNSYLKGIKFDRIIFNLRQPRETQIKKHRELVWGFLSNAKKMINEDGEIHISHKTSKFHFDWNVKELASFEVLCLAREVKFNLRDYPGYETKYGFGGDKNFDCNPSKTYMWRIVSTEHY